jgi:hypothetical protein
MEAIIKWKNYTNVIEVRIFFGAIEYLQNFIASFLIVGAPLHIITTSGKSFQWGNNQ